MPLSGWRRSSRALSSHRASSSHSSPSWRATRARRCAGGISAATSATASCCASRRRSAAECCAANQTSTGFVRRGRRKSTRSANSGAPAPGRRSRAAPLAYVSEDAPWGGRCYSCLAPGSRPTTLTYHAGPDASGQILFKHRKGCTNGQSQWIAQGDGGPVRVPCCCFLPYLDTLDAHDQKLGRSEYVCDACLFVPKYRVLGPAGEAWYAVRPDTCVCGMCVECRCGGRGAKCCRVPFYVRHPETRAKLDGGNAVFVDLWAGWAAEVCTRRDLYEMKFPAGATSAQKCTLLGCAHLIDLTVKEQEGT